MNLKINKKSGSEAEIEASLTEEEFGEFFENSARDEMAKVEIKGFRKGQAPEKIAREYINYDKAFEKAAERAIKTSLKKITEENEWDLIDAPKVEISEAKKGFKFKASLVFLPEVKLNDYKRIIKELNKETKEKIEKITVEKKEVEEAVDWLLHSREHNHKEEKECEHKEEKKELTDEIAKTFGDFKTAEELKKSIEEGIKTEKIIREADKNRAKIINKISEETKIDVPEVMIKKMTENMKEEIKESLGGEEKYNQYIEKNFKGKEEELLKKFKDQSLKEIKAHLIIDEIARGEKIMPEEKEVEEEMTKILNTMPVDKKNEADLKKVYDYSFGKVKNEKVFKFLEKI